MADDDNTATTTEVPPTTPPEAAASPPDESNDRAEKLAKDLRSAKESAKHAQKRADELQRLLEERENAGLPEVEQMKRRLEAAEKRAEENERKAQEAESLVQRAKKQSWVTAAAQAANFADPSDAAAFVKLDELDDEKDAERAVKRLAAEKKHLIKSDEPRLPGRVLENGRTPAPAGASGGIDLDAEAQMVSNELKKFLARRTG